MIYRLSFAALLTIIIGCSAGSDTTGTNPNNGGDNKKKSAETNTVFAFTMAHGVYRSTNNGGSWAATSPTTNHEINGATFAANSHYIFAATTGLGLLRSSDNG